MEAWKEACAMRRSGKEPSRVDLASHFSSALDPDHSLHGGPQIIPEVRGCHRSPQDRLRKMPFRTRTLPQKALWHTLWAVDPLTVCHSLAAGPCHDAADLNR